MQRIVCLDYGEKRVGLAWSDLLGLTAQAQPYLSNDGTLFKQIEALVNEHRLQTIVMGLPTNRHGEDTKKTTEVRAFAVQLEEKFNVKVAFQDERFSTVAVERHLISADVSRKKRKEVVDGQAAAFILQGYLDKNSQ
jgi:putative holliday junction resolvase